MKFAELPFEAQQRLLINNRAFSIACQIIAEASRGLYSREQVAINLSRPAIRDVEEMPPEQVLAAMIAMDEASEKSEALNADVLSVLVSNLVSPNMSHVHVFLYRNILYELYIEEDDTWTAIIEHPEEFCVCLPAPDREQAIDLAKKTIDTICTDLEAERQHLNCIKTFFDPKTGLRRPSN